MSVKTGIRNFFGFILLLVGFVLAILGIIGTVKETDKSTYIVLLVVGIVFYILGVLLSKYKKDNTKKIVLGGFAGILAIALVIGLVVPTESEKRQQEIENADAWKNEDNHIMAYIIMQRYVKERLKSPSTAKFPSVDFKYQNREDNVYYIDGYVDSQNSFGATIRTNFVGVIQQTGKDTWQLKDLALE
jgi:hypothetical protein